MLWIARLARGYYWSKFSGRELFKLLRLINQHNGDIVFDLVEKFAPITD